MKTHELKCWIEFFQPLYVCEKMFEVRNNDRNYRIGDRLMLKEFNPEDGSYTGRYCYRTITYILSTNPFLDLKDMVILSLIIGDQYKP